MKKINFINLRKENSTYFNQFKKHLSKSLKDSNFILGNDLETFEKNLAKYLGVKYAISVSNGTIALYLALKSLKLNKNDELHIKRIAQEALLNVKKHSQAKTDSLFTSPLE